MQRKVNKSAVILFISTGIAISGITQEPSGLESQIHETIDQSYRSGLAGKNWEVGKKSLGRYDRTQLAKALIAELDMDRGSSDLNDNRDAAVRTVFREMHLPSSVVLPELKRAQSPYKKYQLMWCLPKTDAPEVIAALEAQLRDQRIAVTISQKYIEMAGPTHGFRVCDIACAILNKDIGRTSPEIGWATPIEARDEIIDQTCKELKLDVK